MLCVYSRLASLSLFAFGTRSPSAANLSTSWASFPHTAGSVHLQRWRTCIGAAHHQATYDILILLVQACFPLQKLNTTLGCPWVP